MSEQDIDQYRSVIEEDLTWRLEEIAFFSSQLNNISPKDSSSVEKDKAIVNQNRYRKVLVTTLYSHFEGFFRQSFEVYAEALNSQKILVDEAIDCLVASSLDRIFEAYDNDNKWQMYDSDDLNKVNKRLQNRIILMQNFNANRNEHVQLYVGNYKDKLSIVHTESNLNPDVVDKVLYKLGVHKKLGLNHNDFSQLMGLISELVSKRNGIAHGDRIYKDGVSENEYEKFKMTFDRIVKLIPVIITTSLRSKLYLKEKYR